MVEEGLYFIEKGVMHNYLDSHIYWALKQEEVDWAQDEFVG